MKSIQASSILAALAILLTVAIIFVTKNNSTEISQTNQAPTTQTDDNEPMFFNGFLGRGDAPASAERVASAEIPQTNQAPTTQTNDNEPMFFNGFLGRGDAPASAERVAIVEIVYPRFPGESLNPCTTETNSEGKKITHISIAEGTQLCNLSEAQINSLAQTTSYEKEKVCSCITDFCGTDVQPDEFVKCLNKPERL